MQSIVEQMNAEFAKKEKWYVADVGKKANLIGLYKDENAAKELRIKNLEKQLSRLKTQKGISRIKWRKAPAREASTQTEPPTEAQDASLPFEISLETPEQPPNASHIKSTLLANFPASEFEKSTEFPSGTAVSSYDKNLEKSSVRLEVISKQEEILLNLNKHLNSDSAIYEEKPVEKPRELAPVPEQPKGPELGISLKKFSQTLMNVIEMNNRVLKVP